MAAVPVESRQILYCRGYKYQLREDAWFYVGINPPRACVTELVRLVPAGWLRIGKYFAWDGCSFPALDDDTNARACLVHDALYYLMRMGLLDRTWRPAADALLARYMLTDGAPGIRAAYYERAVNLCAAAAASPANARQLLVAPRMAPAPAC